MLIMLSPVIISNGDQEMSVNVYGANKPHLYFVYC